MTLTTTMLAPLPVALPLMSAALVAGLRQWLPRTAADLVSIVTAAVTFLISFTLLRHAMDHTIVYWFGNWYPRGHLAVGICFVIDPVAAGLASLAALLTLLALIFSWRFVDAGANHYHPLMLVFLAAMSGFGLTGDLFDMFVFFELMSTAAFALCGLKTQESAPLQGAFNFAVTNTIAAFMVLTGIGLLYAVTGALNLAQMGSALGSRHDPTVLFAATLLTCGFLVKAAIAPFHFWLPDAHAVAPTPVCVLFSGLMVELGLYAVLRLHVVLFSQTFAAHRGGLEFVLVALGVLTVLLGGVMCFAEHHLKRMLAFSTISHAGLMLIALALHSPLAIAGMLLYLLAHALVKSGLFFSSGIVLHRLRTISEPRLFGRGREMRFTAVLWFLGAAGLAGAPPFATMLGEALTSKGAASAGEGWVTAVFVTGGLLTGGAVLRAGFHIFAGWGDSAITDHAAIMDELPETGGEEAKVFWYHYAPAAICILAAAVLSFVPGLRAHMLVAAERLVDQSAYVKTVYSGATAPLAISPSMTHESLTQPVWHGALALALALLLALSSVLRLHIPRRLRVGAFLEGPLPWLRALQSGHSGDYVLWLTIGVTGVGAAFLLLLR